jgi:hypothetical protein
MDFLNETNFKFKSDMDQYFTSLGEETKLTDDSIEIFNLKIKFTLFYFELYKKFFKSYIMTIGTIITSSVSRQREEIS